MKFNYRLLLIFFVLIYSCKKNDNKNVEDLLTQAPWKLIRIQRTVYADGHLDTVYTSSEDNNNDVLSFNNNSLVTLSMNSISDPLSGKWMIDANKQILTTDLRLNLSSSTGYNAVLFYPNNRIIQLNGTDLILEFTSMAYTYHDYTKGTTKVSNYIDKRFFTH